jgi:hypothetical protein
MFVIWDLQIKEVWPPTKKFIRNPKKRKERLLRLMPSDESLG